MDGYKYSKYKLKTAVKIHTLPKTRRNNGKLRSHKQAIR
jgi:hypothetical protein